MDMICYCLDCQRIFDTKDVCKFCNSDRVKELKKGTSVNVIGTKNKGKILFVKRDMITVIVNTEQNEKVVREFKPETLRKVL